MIFRLETIDDDNDDDGEDIPCLTFLADMLLGWLSSSFGLVLALCSEASSQKPLAAATEDAMLSSQAAEARSPRNGPCLCEAWHGWDLGWLLTSVEVRFYSICRCAISAVGVVHS